MDDRPPVTPDLEEGVMGLTQVEPSPVEETPAEFKEDYFPSTSSEPKRTSTLGLGNHGAAWYRKYPHRELLKMGYRCLITIPGALQHRNRGATKVV